MSTTMFDAREALIHGSVYDRQIPHAPMDPAAFHDAYSYTHDRMGYIGAERAIPAAAAARIPVPVGMFIPPVPPPHHNYFGQVWLFAVGTSPMQLLLLLTAVSVVRRRKWLRNDMG